MSLSEYRDFQTRDALSRLDKSGVWVADSNIVQVGGVGPAGVHPIGQRPWTPRVERPLFWFDPDDANSITVASGAVSRLEDKSGLENAATQTTSGLRMVVTPAAMNGRTVVTADGVDDIMSCPAITASAGVELFFALKQNKTGSARNGGIMLLTAHTDSQPHFGGGPDNTALQDWYETFFTDGQYLISSDNIPPGDYIGSLAHTGTQLVGRIHGTHVGAVTAPFVGTATYVRIGGTTGGTPVYSMNGYAELFLLQSPSELTRQKAFGYLAHKWGTVAALDSSNPYKTTVPVE